MSIGNPSRAPVEQDIKSTEYEFELISGNMKAVHYQKDEIDGYSHFYHYDEMNRLKEVSPKNIRNSVISYWLNGRNISLEDVQVMAGHCYPSTTEKYINPNTHEQQEAVNKLHNDIFN